MSKEIAKQIKENQDVLPSKTINGYYVRTIFCKNVGEVRIKVLVVYKDKESKEIIQYNVDVENLFGTLLYSDCWQPDTNEYITDQDSIDLAQEVVKNIEIARRK